MTDENAFPYKNEYERMIYQRKKLEQQDELSDNMIDLTSYSKISSDFMRRHINDF